MLRANLKRYPHVVLRGDVEVTSVTQNRPGRVRVSFLDRVRGGEQSVEASYVLGCDGANSMVRASIGSHMYGLPFQQDWVVIDVDTDAELNQWEGCHQLCSVQRAGTYMRVGQTRYRWEFRLLDGETAADYQTIERHRAADQAVAGRHTRRAVAPGTRHRLHVPGPGGQSLARPQCVRPR